MSVAEMGLVLFAVEKGYLNDELNKIADLNHIAFYMSSEHKDFMEGLSETDEYSDEVLKTFTDALDKFKLHKLINAIPRNKKTDFIFQILRKLLALWKW